MTSPASSVLVLGGTSWLGGRVAALAREAGHDVTCLARGESGTVPQGVTLVRGDRSRPDAYTDLPDRRWDLVVDVARQPGHVRSAVGALSDRADAWAFVSSCSVYASHADHAADESAAVLPALEADEATAEQYGEGKVACEQAVLDARDGAALVARSGLIVGSGDPSERFGYWPSRFALAARDGGPVLVPEQTDRPVQWVHVDDLAAWLLSAGLAGTTGVVNASGATTPLGAVLDAAADASGFVGERVPASDEALAAASVEEYMGPRSLPLWLHDVDWLGFQDRDTSAARSLGLAQRPLADTVRDALAWEEHLGLDRPRTRAGLDRADELAVIAGIRSR
ncbi:NAD-dependent epimerase/dehydratase family protein [Intrasporangium sp. YIM S08009]|uniref:NAD-dependent epimerase/dehydratase family protein n=1 Tax=Intrasporangium zincisolvens TaxID=3080018 RepID=UPI002B058018|nr:NAD-dependent epimerase/dehydratase family protein [Intrasporangium sp. YIM S08009]